METVVDYYTGYDEEGRLIRHRAEFIATTFLLKKWIGSEARILDVGAGAGAYTLYLASQGHSVTAVDPVPKHVDLIESKVTSSGNLNVSVVLGDARDLSAFTDSEFDTVLCMGPIYHLDGDEVRRAVQECTRVLRSGGIFCGAYVHRYAGYAKDQYREFFCFRSAEEFEGLLGDYPLRPLCHAPVDGPAYSQLEEGPLVSADHLARAHTWIDEHSYVLDLAAVDDFVHGLWIGRKTA